MVSPLQDVLTGIVGLVTSRLSGRTIELSSPNGAVVARIERVAVVPSDPAPTPVLDPVTWWLDTIDQATANMARLFGLAGPADVPAAAVDLLESAELTLCDVTAGGRRVDRLELRAVSVDAVLGIRSIVRSGPITLIATLTVDDVRTWLPDDAAKLGRTLRLRADGRVSVGWRRGPLEVEMAGRVEPHAHTVDVVADRLRVLGWEVTIPLRWQRRRSLSTASLAAVGATVRDVTVHEDALTVRLAIAGWNEPVTYEQLVRLQVRLIDEAGRVALDLMRGRNLGSQVPWT